MPCFASMYAAIASAATNNTTKWQHWTTKKECAPGNSRFHLTKAAEDVKNELVFVCVHVDVCMGK